MASRLETSYWRNNWPKPRRHAKSSRNYAKLTWPHYRNICLLDNFRHFGERCGKALAMTEHLNYCRKIAKQMAEIVATPNVTPELRSRALQLLDLAAASQKFLLPDGGIVIDDRELRGLGGDLPLRLPHPFVALEFRTMGPSGATGGGLKTVLFIREHQDTDSLCVTPAFFYTNESRWDWYDDALIPIHFYIGNGNTTPDGKPALNFAFPENSDPMVYAQVVSVVLGFINALSCANVVIERSPARKTANKPRKALPFDDYHLLVIGNARTNKGQGGDGSVSHRSPREHLRRGHIRRLADGRRIWVNATVVAAGRGGGVVIKDYALQTAS